MRKSWYLGLLALAFLATGICAAEIPNLVGNWTGSWDAYLGNEFTSSTANGSINYAFTEQEGRIFVGKISSKLENGTEFDKGFVGAIGLDNQSLYIAESDRGYTFGTIISSDEIELIYLQDGENIEASIDSIHRIEE
jgi:hypothetical protein